MKHAVHMDSALTNSSPLDERASDNVPAVGDGRHSVDMDSHRCIDQSQPLNSAIACSSPADDGLET
eukprot:2342345-Alexandrium_andersonii.AAC.1